MMGNNEWEYNSIVQGYYHQRALFAKDYHAAAKITTLYLSQNGKSAKAYEKIKVNNLHTLAWQKEHNRIMYQLIRSSYMQTGFLRRRLLSTGESKLVYITTDPTERYWSCGLRYGDADVSDSNKWTGRNSLGIILMKVRDEVSIIK